MSFTLPNFLHWAPFNALREQMQAPLISSFGAPAVFRPIELPIEEKLKDEGLEVDINDIVIREDQTLEFQGFRVLVYIRDVVAYGDRTSMPRYHLAYCGTLQRMFRDNRSKRYVVANRDDGLFLVNQQDGTFKPKTLQLNVCQMCLDTIAWQEFQMALPLPVRTQRVAKFSLKDFFKTYPRDLISNRPEHHADSAPLNVYTSDWSEVSQRKKRENNYACRKCPIQLTWGESKYLHVHHRNAQKYDNADSNLEVLCIRCHAEEPMHGHVKNLPDYVEFMATYINGRA